MKREILFRAWDKVEGKYFEPIYEAYKGNLLDLSISLNGRILRRTIELPAEDESCFQDRYILEQFTGLTDKNGVKIFEGDIIAGNIIAGNGEDVPNRAVEWSNDYLGYFVGLGQDDMQYPLYDVLFPEVIGTIHDNPKLINK